MGQAILYCFRCSTQLRDSHFESGKAFKMDGRACCSACAPEALKSLPQPQVEQLLKQIATPPVRPSASSVAIRSVTPRQPSPVIRSSQRKSPAVWIAVGIAGAVVAVLLAVVLSSGNDRLPPEPAEKHAVKQPGPPPAPREKEPPPPAPDSPAKQSLDAARKFAREHPEDLYGQLRLFEDLTLQGDKSEAGAEARKESQSLRARGKETVERAVAAFTQEIAGPLSREEFGATIDALEAAKSKMEWPDWRFALDHKSREILDQMNKLYEPARAKAVEAKSKNDAAELEKVVARIRHWGSPRLDADLAGALAGVALPPIRIVLQNFEKDAKGWGFVGGQEFPGAKGLAVLDTNSTHAGKGAYRLEADFSKGGAYVGVWLDLTTLQERDIQEFHLWVKTATVARLGIRLGDNSDQCHQKNGGIALKPVTEWQEVVLRVSDLVGGEHWGGANDGKWHGPAKGLGINLGKGNFTSADLKQGVIWIDDVEAVVIPASR